MDTVLHRTLLSTQPIQSLYHSTMKNKFRSVDDLMLVTLVAPHVGIMSTSALESAPVSSSFIYVGFREQNSTKCTQLLEVILQEHPIMFCINDCRSDTNYCQEELNQFYSHFNHGLLQDVVVEVEQNPTSKLNLSTLFAGLAHEFSIQPIDQEGEEDNVLDADHLIRLRV